MRFAITCALALVAVGCAAPPAAHPPPVKHEMLADILLVGGRIYTMNDAAPRATAVAIRDGKIVMVGEASDAPAAKRIVNLSGRSVTPGLVDAHCHLHGLGVALDELSLKGLRSVDDVKRVVSEADRSRTAGEWITGRGWDQNLWTPAAFPTHDPLDAAAPSHPVVLERVDGHALWVNAAALKLAGISKDTPDPAGGKIIRDAAGQPTGVLVDNATELVERKMPAETPEVTERRILRAASQAVSLGLTGVHEMGIDDQTVSVYRALAASGKLPLRVYAYLAGAGRIDTLPTRKPDVDADGTAMFVLRGVKMFADGALGSRGASLLAPYDDEPKSTGLTLTSAEELARAAKIVAQSGFQLAVHAIGDKGNRAVLDAYAAAGSTPAKDLRFRVEHAQVLAPEDIPRFASMGVIASMQPTHATSDMPWAEARIGPQRIKGAYAWRSMLKTGAHLAFGSDFPVEETSPLLGVYAAVTRRDANGKPEGGWYPDQILTLDEALRAFTVEPAWASFVEGKRGKVAVGMVADLTVYDRVLTPDHSLLEAKVEMVIVGGKVAFER